MRALATITAIAAAALLSVPAFAQFKKSADQKIDNADAAAMKQLAQANLNEVESGKAAAAKAQNPEVKQFAQKMVTDHQQMYNELLSLAKQKGVALPQSGSLKEKAQSKLAERASGADFDKKYMEEMVKEHQKDVQDTQNVAAKAKDPDFKRAVEKAHAKIQEHLQMAQSIASKTGAAAGGSAPSSSSANVNPHTSFSKQK
jgi:putative membrane protein